VLLRQWRDEDRETEPILNENRSGQRHLAEPLLVAGERSPLI
jgi:hypothetical protein